MLVSATFRSKAIGLFHPSGRYPSVHGLKRGCIDPVKYNIETIEEAQDFATQWLWTYNNDRPNTRIGGITPAQKLKMAA